MTRYWYKSTVLEQNSLKTGYTLESTVQTDEGAATNHFRVGDLAGCRPKHRRQLIQQFLSQSVHHRVWIFSLKTNLPQYWYNILPAMFISKLSISYCKICQWQNIGQGSHILPVMSSKYLVQTRTECSIDIQYSANKFGIWKSTLSSWKFCKILMPCRSKGDNSKAFHGMTIIDENDKLLEITSDIFQLSHLSLSNFNQFM